MNQGDRITEECFKGSAVYVNHASVTSQGDSHRLTFLEVDPLGIPHFKAAVLIPTNVLHSLHEIIGKHLHKPTIIKPDLKAN